MTAVTRTPRAFEDAARNLLDSSRGAAQALKAEFRDSLLARGHQQQQLAAQARDIRQKNGNNQLLVRASLEFSNYCRQQCSFCGMTRRNSELQRFRLKPAEIRQIIDQVADMGITQLHLVAGEDWQPGKFLEKPIQYATDLGMETTLAIGQRSSGEYRRWREAGASRYILKVETTSEEAFNRARTGTKLFRRVSHLLYLRSLGFKIGSGVICGLPGQSVDDLVADLLFFKMLQPDMVSVSRFLPNGQSRYAANPEGDQDTTLNFVSLLRINLDRPDLRIPSGTTLGHRQLDGLLHGANLVSFHATPAQVASLYSADMIHTREMKMMSDIRRLSEKSGLILPEMFLRSRP